MNDAHFVVIVDVCDQIVDPKKNVLQKFFYCRKFDGVKHEFIRIPTKHPCLLSIFRITPTAKKLPNENLICNQRKLSYEDGMYLYTFIELPKGNELFILLFENIKIMQRIYFYITDEIPLNSQILEKDEDIFDSLSFGGSECQTYMMSIPDDIDQFLHQQTDELRNYEYRNCVFRFKYLEAVLKSIFKDSMQLKFVSQILQSNNENSFAFNDTSYVLHRMSYEGPKLEILYEVQKGSEDGQIVLESLHLSKGIKFSVEREKFADAEATCMLHVQFQGSESTIDKSLVLKHFVLLAVRAICENLHYFRMPKEVDHNEKIKSSAVFEILVPQKWWNANELDNISWNKESLALINRLIKSHISGNFSQEEKDTLTMIQMVPSSVEDLINYLSENTECLKESNISFVISSSNKIPIFLKND